jgi:hypothetical protein
MSATTATAKRERSPDARTAGTLPAPQASTMHALPPGILMDAAEGPCSRPRSQP